MTVPRSPWKKKKRWWAAVLTMRLVLPPLWPAAGVASAYAEGHGWIADCSPIVNSFGDAARWVGHPIHTYYYGELGRSYRLGRSHGAWD